MKDPRSEDKELPPGLKMMAVFVVIIILLILLTAIFYFRFKKLHDPEYLFAEAQAAYEGGYYEAAEERLDEVLSLLPDDEAALKLKALVLRDSGRPDEAAAIYRVLIEKEPGDKELYQALLLIYEEQEDPGAIADLLASAPEEIFNEFSYYLPADPVILTEDGTYSDLISVEISGSEKDTIRFTTDGTDPTKTSPVYNGPITLEEGRNEIRAAAFSEKGLMSRVVTGIYEIELPLPGAPEILPESGAYPPGTAIMVTIPPDASVFYAFDGVPTPESERYTVPVPMPDGTHIFSAIVVDSAGKVSAPSSQTYIAQ